MKWLANGASANRSRTWTTTSCRALSATTTTRTSWRRFTARGTPTSSTFTAWRSSTSHRRAPPIQLRPRWQRPRLWLTRQRLRPSTQSTSPICWCAHMRPTSAIRRLRRLIITTIINSTRLPRLWEAFLCPLLIIIILLPLLLLRPPLLIAARPDRPLRPPLLLHPLRRHRHPRLRMPTAMLEIIIRAMLIMVR